MIKDNVIILETNYLKNKAVCFLDMRIIQFILEESVIYKQELLNNQKELEKDLDEYSDDYFELDCGLDALQDMLNEYNNSNYENIFNPYFNFGNIEDEFEDTFSKVLFRPKEKYNPIYFSELVDQSNDIFIISLSDDLFSQQIEEYIDFSDSFYWKPKIERFINNNQDIDVDLSINSTHILMVNILEHLDNKVRKKQIVRKKIDDNELENLIKRKYPKAYNVSIVLSYFEDA